MLCCHKNISADVLLSCYCVLHLLLFLLSFINLTILNQNKNFEALYFDFVNVSSCFSNSHDPFSCVSFKSKLSCYFRMTDQVPRPHKTVQVPFLNKNDSIVIRPFVGRQLCHCKHESHSKTASCSWQQAHVHVHCMIFILKK